MTPLEQEQVITADNGYDALRTVVVAGMPAQPSGEVELTKNGTYDVKNYATAVVSVGEEKDVNFYDYDGTLVASYTIEQAKTLSQLPPAPDHSQDEVPLTFQEWNYTLEEINALDHIADVGANYITTDGKTYIYFFLNKVTGLSPTLQFGRRNVAYSYNLYKLPENTLVDTYSDETISSSTAVKQLENITQYGNYKLELTVIGTNNSIAYADSILDARTITKVYFGNLWYQSEITSSIVKTLSIPTSMVGNTTVRYAKCFVFPRFSANNNITSSFYNCEKICTNPTMATYSAKLGTILGSVQRLAVYSKFSAINYSQIKQLYLSPTLTSVGSLTYNDSLEELVLPQAVTTTGNYSYAATRIGQLKKAIFLGDIKTFNGRTFGAVSNQSEYGQPQLELIDLSNCTSVPNLTETQLPTDPQLKIKVPDALYDDFIVATNWVTYANNIVKASEYVEE